MPNSRIREKPLWKRAARQRQNKKCKPPISQVNRNFHAQNPPPPDDGKPKPKQPLHRSAVISTFNIENLYSNNVHLSTLLGTIDIIAIQEHWLFKFEKSKLQEFAENYKFSCFIKSVDENLPYFCKAVNSQLGWVCFIMEKRVGPIY